MRRLMILLPLSLLLEVSHIDKSDICWSSSVALVMIIIAALLGLLVRGMGGENVAHSSFVFSHPLSRFSLDKYVLVSRL